MRRSDGTQRGTLEDTKAEARRKRECRSNKRASGPSNVAQDKRLVW